ncbi:MAG TPA: hypothetical protein VK738_11830 [Terriglobales bacterium]|nr:hypothetical protein [Terriglobales bacterium]
MADAYSIRESLQGALQDFVRGSGFTCVHLEAMIREFVSFLASYREEDTPLFPEVFVFTSPDGLKALAPSSDQMTLGKEDLDAEAVVTILKNCAPLAKDGWAIFVVKENGQLRYGVFRSIRHSLATVAVESMCDLGKDLPVILVRNRGHLTVELRNTNGEFFTVSLTTTPAKGSTLEKHVSSFVEAATASLENAERFKQYFHRLLTEILQRCHGTLLAVIPCSLDKENLGSLQDGVWPEPPLKLHNLYTEAMSTNTAEAVANLHAAEILLTGMINSDGVVVFNSKGAVVAFHVFLQPQEKERNSLSDEGGGRRRTYELMKLRLKAGFAAVFFRSHDGDTKCEVSQ